MAFGAKVKLTVDKRNQKGFRDEIQSLVDNATKNNPLKIQDVKITLSKDGQDKLRTSIQDYLKMDKNGLKIYVNKIDAKNAIKAFRSELETMLSGLSITGLKDFLGADGIEKTFEKAAEASNKIAEAQNKSDTKSTLQSLQKDIEATYKNNKVTTSPFVDDLTKQYKELNSELERTQKLEGEAQQAAIKALSTKVDGFKEFVNTSHNSQKAIKDIQSEIDAAYKKNTKTTDPSQSTAASNMYQELYSDIENIKTLEGEAQQAAIAGIRERATEFKKYMNLIQGGQQTVKLLETELNNASKNSSKLTGAENENASSLYSEISNEIANVKNLEGAELESAVANISAKTNALKEYIRTTYESQEAIRIAANEEEKAAQKTLATLKKVNTLYNRGANYIKQNPHVAESSYGVKINSLLSMLGSKTDITEKEALDAERDLNLFIKAARDAGLEGKRFGDRVLEAYKKFGGWTTVTRTLTFIIQKFKQLVSTVIELDTAMTELRKVTDLSETEYMQFFDTAITRAKTLGATITDVINSTADFARLGYSIGDASELANAAIVYKNVGDGIEDINAASESIISTLKAFGQENLSAMDIVDKFNKIGNEFAISSKGVGDAMQRSSAALAAAGNTIDESIALAVGMNSVLQDPDKVGTVLKTASMYLRAAKTDAEDAGIATDGMAHSVSELRKEILKITDNQVDIMLDNNTFKTTIQQYRELAEVYNKLTDVDQANLLNLIGGKRNATANAALLTNFKDVEAALGASSNASGSALRENEKFLDSVAGKIKSLQIAFQELAATVISSDFLKGFIESLTKLLSGLNSLIDTFGALPPLILAVGTSLGTLSKDIKPFRIKYDENGNRDGLTYFGTQIKDVSKYIKEYNLLLSDTQEARSSYIESIKDEDTAVKKYLTQVNAMGVKNVQAKASLKGMALEMVKTTAKTYLLEAGIFALNAALSMGISALISGIMWGLSKVIDSVVTTQQEVKESAEEALAEYKNITQELEGSKKTIREISRDYERLSKGVDEFGNNISLSTDEYAQYNEIVNKIADMFPKMVEGYTDEDNAIIKHKGNVEALTEAYNEQKKSAEDAVITSAGTVFKNFRNKTTVGFLENSKNEFLNAIGKGMPTVEDTEILKRVISKDITNNDTLFNGFAFTRIKNAIIAAGIEGPRGGETDSLYVKRIADEYPHILQSILSTIETENVAALSEIRPIIDIYLERNTEYRTLNKEQKDSIKKIVDSLGYEFFKQYESVEDSITAIVDKYITPLQDSDIASKFNIALDAQTKYNNGEIPYNDFYPKVLSLFESLKDKEIPFDVREKIMSLFDYEFILVDDESLEGYYQSDGGKLNRRFGKEIADKVKGLKKDEIEAALTIDPETISSYEDLKIAIDSVLVKNKEANEIIASTEKLKQYSESLDKIQSAYNSVKSAIEEYNTAGVLSVDTFQSLIELEPKYLSMLLDENGNLNLSTESLKNNTAALIDNMGIQAARNLINSMQNYSGEAEQLEYLTGVTDDLTDSTWGLVYSELANMATVSSPVVMQALYSRIDAIRQMTELTKQGIGSGGLDSSITDTKEKIEDLNKKARLDNLKHEISSVELGMEQLKATLDSLEESFDKLFDGDYIGKQEILSKQFEIGVELGKQYREEFERLAAIQPQSADEANELAGRLETLGSAIRENAHNLIEYNKQINELRISAISGYSENVAAQLDRELKLINNSISSITEGSVFGDNFSFDFLFPSIPETAIEKQRKQNKELLEEEEKHNDEIFEIKRKALELEKKENDKARAKERESLIKSLEFNKAAITSTAEEVSNTAITTAKTTAEVVKTELKTAIDDVEKSLSEFKNNSSTLGYQGLEVALKTAKEIFEDETSTETELESAIALLNAAIKTLITVHRLASNPSPAPGTGGGSTKNPFSQYGVTSDMQNNRTVMGQTRDHKGVDYGLPSGTPVIAPVSGTVMTGIAPNGFGNYVVVTDSSGYQQWFGHLSKSYSNLNGQYVKAGTVIGLSGNTGRSTGAHLHYEIRTPNGGRLHPDVYLAQRANGGIVGKGETTLVNELGQESAILPNGKFVLLGNEAKLVDMPIGTQVINHKDTADILKYTGNSINNTPIQKLASGNTSVTVDTSSIQETDTVVINADKAEVKAETSTSKSDIKELEAWIEKYTTSSSYDTYSSEFHKAYTDYLAHRQGLADEIEDLKKRRDLLDIGSDERKNLENQIRSKAIALDEYDINEGYDTQIAMVESSATKLNQAYNDLLWEYTQAIGRGESAEVLKLYQDGLTEISDQMNSVDEHWKSIHESQKEYLISVAEEVGRAFDSIYKEADKQIENIEDKIKEIESLRDPASVSTKFNTYKEKMSAAEEGYNHAISEQEMHHVAAEEARRQYSSISGKYDTDSWFDIDGELNLNYKRDLAMMSSEELKKAEKLAEILQVHKQGYYEAGEAAKDYKDLFTETNNAMYEEAQNIEKEAVEQIVKMIEYRKEKELEAIEEIHEKTVELLDERREIIEDMYSRQLELLDDVKTEEDYHRELNEETDKLNQIQLEINKYSLIDTSAARTKVSELQKQLEEQQKIIDEKQREKEYQDKKEALEEDRDLLLDSLDQKVEDENDAYDAIKEAIEDRYEEEKVYAEAMEAYQTGKLATFVEKSATAYDQIGTDATLEIKGIGEAFDDFFVDTGLSIDNFTKNEMLTWLNSFAPVKQALEEIIELKTEAFNFGQGSANSEDGSAWETTLNRLQTENGFGWDEIERTQDVIADLNSKKQDTADQWEYLRYLVDYEKDRTLKVIAARKASGEEITLQEEYLRTICSIFGDSIPTYHTGKIPNWLSKNEELSIIKDDETVLTKSMTESLLSKVSTLEILKEKLIPKLGGFVSNLPTLNNHTSTIGDIHITIQANEVSKIDRRMLNAWGNDIMNNIKTEFGFSS